VKASSYSTGGACRGGVGGGGCRRCARQWCPTASRSSSWERQRRRSWTFICSSEWNDPWRRCPGPRRPGPSSLQPSSGQHGREASGSTLTATVGMNQRPRSSDCGVRRRSPENTVYGPTDVGCAAQDRLRTVEWPARTYEDPGGLVSSGVLEHEQPGDRACRWASCGVASASYGVLSSRRAGPRRRSARRARRRYRVARAGSYGWGEGPSLPVQPWPLVAPWH
jgi:hypothetical protein